MMAETSKNARYRRRGRPAGKNRVPLSLEERRNRNANYERQRRQETSEAMADLAEAAGCDPNGSHADILANVLSQLQGATESSNMVEDMRLMNEKLMVQIQILEQRLIDEAGHLKSSKSTKRVRSSQYKSSENHMTAHFLNESSENPIVRQEEFHTKQEEYELS